MIRFVNQTGSAQEWAADVLDGSFVARVSVSVRDGVQLVRLRRMVDGRAAGIIREQTSPKGRPWGQDDVYDLVVSWVHEERNR